MWWEWFGCTPATQQSLVTVAAVSNKVSSDSLLPSIKAFRVLHATQLGAIMLDTSS